MNPPATVVLCLQDSSLLEPIGTTNTTIEATLCYGFVYNDCDTVWHYKFQYDDELLADPDVPLIAADVVGVFCKNCQTDWIEQIIRLPVSIGTTAARPILSSLEIGVMYLDTTLVEAGRPIWWTGTIWVKSDGTAA